LDKKPFQFSLQRFAEDPNAGGGKDGGGKDGGTAGKTFTQEDIDRIINERLERVRGKYKDYDDMKKAADELKTLKESKMTDDEKVKARIAELEKKLGDTTTELTRERTERLKVKILDDMKLPTAWASRIFGTTEEEIKKDAAELKKLLGEKGTSLGGGSNPGGDQGGRTDMNGFIRTLAGR
jgi:DNA repair exonuclease SbcCD ATPase subunit